MKFVKRFYKKVSGLLAVAVVMAVTAISVSADATTPASLLDSSATGVVQDFAADIIPTVVGLLLIVVPAGLALWGIGFGVKKGIGFIRKQASKAV